MLENKKVNVFVCVRAPLTETDTGRQRQIVIRGPLFCIGVPTVGGPEGERMSAARSTLPPFPAFTSQLYRTRYRARYEFRFTLFLKRPPRRRTGQSPARRRGAHT